MVFKGELLESFFFFFFFFLSCGDQTGLFIFFFVLDFDLEWEAKENLI